MSEELKPCPFCGGKAKFRTVTNNIHYVNRGFMFDIVCSKCDVTIPRRYELEFTLGENGELRVVLDEREIAAKEWNRRASNEN